MTQSVFADYRLKCLNPDGERKSCRLSMDQEALYLHKKLNAVVKIPAKKVKKIFLMQAFSESESPRLIFGTDSDLSVMVPGEWLKVSSPVSLGLEYIDSEHHKQRVILEVGDAKREALLMHLKMLTGLKLEGVL